MLSLPKATELNKQLPKKAIYAKFHMNPAAKDKFDGDISKIMISGEISPATVSIAAGAEISSIFVLLVTLKRQNFDPNTIALLSKLIDQKMLLVLEYNGQRCLAIYHNKLIFSNWTTAENCKVTLKGLNLDSVWENLIQEVGQIQISEGRTLDQQIAEDEKRAKLEKEIQRLEKLARAEKQPKKKFELAERIHSLEKEISS